MINDLLRKLANARGEPEAPTPGEMALLHTLYLTGIAILVFAVSLVSAIFFAPALFLLYGELVLVSLTALWLVYRLVRGYLGLVRCRRVGFVPPPYS